MSVTKAQPPLGRRRHRWVCIYDVDRAYGGPEEGGWWYDTGYPLWQYARCFSSRHSHEAVNRYLERLRGICRRLNKEDGRRYDIGSVSSLGQYWAFGEIDGERPAPFPRYRPYYS